MCKEFFCARLRRHRDPLTQISAESKKRSARTGGELVNDPDYEPVSKERRERYIRIGRDLANDPDYEPVSEARRERYIRIAQEEGR